MVLSKNVKKQEQERNRKKLSQGIQFDKQTLALTNTHILTILYTKFHNKRKSVITDLNTGMHSLIDIHILLRKF